MNQLGSGWSLAEREPETIAELLPYWEWFYEHYFWVKSDGWQHLPPQGPALLIGSHNGGLAAPDMIMTMVDWFRHFGTERAAYGLMHPNIWQINPHLAALAVKVGAIQAHPKMAIAALRRGACVLVYPGGAQDVFRPHCQRHQIHLSERKGFIKLSLREQVPLIPIVSCGAHDTLIVLADCYEQVKLMHQWGMPWLFDLDPEVFPLYIGLPWGLAIGPWPNFPWPFPIHLRVCPPIVFERYGREAARDRIYVAACYEQVRCQMQQTLDQLVAEVSN
jgi:1-acyl-sn-glycerol-3-phosphate acyltransferase